MAKKKSKDSQDAAEKLCRRCGQSKWRFVTIKEPVDRTFLLTRAEQDIEYRVCECGYAERVEVVHRPPFFWQK